MTEQQKKDLFMKGRGMYFHAEKEDAVREVRELFASLGDYMNSQDYVKKCDTILEFKLGNIVTYGSYKGKPLRWKILEVEARRCLLFAEDVVDHKAYNTERTNMLWEICSLRQWLNHEFINEAFTPQERMAICAVERENPKNPKYSTQCGGPTNDKVTVFNDYEICEYLPNPEDRAIGKYYWLRTQGHGLLSSECVEPNGDIYPIGLNVADEEVGVRPIICVMVRK
ncbi:hypothetical protein P261_01860 [Lachnospiraceae bacterium TWA4]|nr:hypothetical protein P261_01860 [Lachnospiraceae bacterium TWA4]